MKKLENISNQVVEDLVDSFNENESNELDIVFVLDRSGSMTGSETNTINGFNAFLEREITKGRNTHVTCVLFDDLYDVLYTRKDIKDIEPLTSNEYYTRGCTALYDAIGRTILSLKGEVSDNVLFVIITDGFENASKRFNRVQIKSLIEELDWEFVFVGAEIDSYAEASSIGIKLTHTANFNKSSEGINDLFNTMDELSDAVHNKKDLSSIDWKKNLAD